MKLKYLIAILTLSFSVFSQTNHSISDGKGQLQKGNAQSIDIHPTKTMSLIPLYDSIYVWKWDSILIGWTLKSKTINFVYDIQKNNTSSEQYNISPSTNPYKNNYTYDASNNKINSLYQQWNGTTWVNQFQQITPYDINNNNTSSSYQQWNGTSWDNQSQQTYTFDVSHNVTSHLMQNGSGTSWINLQLQTYTFNINNKITDNITQTWNGTSWVNQWHNSYTYDGFNNLAMRQAQGWTGSAWSNGSQWTYTYNVNNNVTTAITSTPSISSNYEISTYAYDANNDLINLTSQQCGGGPFCINQAQHTYTYNTNHNTTNHIYQNWISGAWNNLNQDIHTYNLNNFETSSLMQKWNGAWINQAQYSRTYDVNNIMLSGVHLSYNGTGVKATGDSTYYYFHTTVGINELNKNTQMLLKFYPNPTNNNVTIDAENETIITISNILGETILTHKLQQGKNEINLNNQASGVYFIRSQNTTFKIIKQD